MIQLIIFNQDQTCQRLDSKRQHPAYTRQHPDYTRQHSNYTHQGTNEVRLMLYLTLLLMAVRSLLIQEEIRIKWDQHDQRQ
jgi:hypothetical protein